MFDSPDRPTYDVLLNFFTYLLPALAMRDHRSRQHLLLDKKAEMTLKDAQCRWHNSVGHITFY